MQKMPKVIDSFDGEYRFLSNFYGCKIDDSGDIFPSTEHLYQAAKTFEQSEIDEIKHAPTGKAKKLGQKVSLRPDWEQVKLSVMQRVLRKKFFQHHFAQKLLDTANSVLVEGNTWGDTYYGICRGVGNNFLGKLLMVMRHQLRMLSKDRSLLEVCTPLDPVPSQAMFIACIAFKVQSETTDEINQIIEDLSKKKEEATNNSEFESASEIVEKITFWEKKKTYAKYPLPKQFLHYGPFTSAQEADEWINQNYPACDDYLTTVEFLNKTEPLPSW